jgi:Rod binding domain-containing protein
MVPNPILAQPAPTDAQIMRYKNLRAQAEKFVAQSFFVPIFKQMRNSPFKSELFGGGRGGEVFQGMLDGVISERMSRGGGKDLVDSMVKKLDPQLAKLMEPSNKARAAAESAARARQFGESKVDLQG